MKIALIHLSDFHIQGSFKEQKINAIINSLNVLKSIDKYILIISGDIAYSGKQNEYKKAKIIFDQIIKGTKIKLSNDFIHVFVVPGNHDLCLPNNARNCEKIQSFYDNDKIEDMIPNEMKYLSNFNKFVYCLKEMPNSFLVNKYVDINGYKIQFNLINTAPFSTLKPDDKELHYFPKDRLNDLIKKKDCNLCVTVMHHSNEFFNWHCKSDLENTIVQNSELLFYGHDHIGSTSSVSINDSNNTFVSAAGSIDFSCKHDSNDSFNTIVIDTSKNVLNSYSFAWNSQNNMFIHKHTLIEKEIEYHSGELTPLKNFINELKKDEYNFYNDFTEYFVFPKLVSKNLDGYKKAEEISDLNTLLERIISNNKVEIIGDTNYGKTTLLKYIYLSLLEKVKPVFLSLEHGDRINPKNFIKHLVEDQYGDDPIIFEKFRQLDKKEKCIFIDGWDLICNKADMHKLMTVLNNEFGIIVYSRNIHTTEITEYIHDKVFETEGNISFEIRPFFKELRNKLVAKICKLKSNNENIIDVEKTNQTIDNVVKNNMDLFTLNPSFIIKYTNYFIDLPLEYSAGESVFNKVFEYELQNSIFQFVKKDDVQEILYKFEELAGYMYDNLSECLKTEDVTRIINNYNEIYGTNIDSKTILEIGHKAKILKTDGDLTIRFHNKNQFAYFIAKYLIKDEQNDKKSSKGIAFALKNICFGINGDIVLFISYILNNMKVINFIFEKTRELLNNWESLDIRNQNIRILDHYTSEIVPPTDIDKQEYDKQIEQAEELAYSNDIIKTTGFFDFDEEKVDDFPNRIIRAIKYSEMLAKSLSSFDSTMKLVQKRELVNCIYEYPKKIIYEFLRPLDEDAENICNVTIQLIQKANKKKSNGKEYTKKDIMKILTTYSQVFLFELLNHFSELCSSKKAFNLLLERISEDYCEQIEKLLIIENSGNTDLLLKQASEMLKLKNDLVTMMVKMGVRKYLLENKSLSFNKKQQLIDKIFGASFRKDFLLYK